MQRRKWFHISAGVAWLIFWGVSVWQGWQEAIALVWFASVYANAVGHWSGAEAADDKAVLERLDRIEALLLQITGDQERAPHNRQGEHKRTCDPT